MVDDSHCLSLHETLSFYLSQLLLAILFMYFFFLLAYRARAHNSIEATRAVDIRAYSASYVEDELLLLPGTILEVMERADRGAGGMAIRLREIESACGLVW